MSAPIERPVRSARSRKALIDLMKEYNSALHEVVSEAREVSERYFSLPTKGGTEENRAKQYYRNLFNAIEGRYHSLLPVVNTLSRRVSQHLEHAEVDELERIQMEVRLADLDSFTTTAGLLLSATRPT